MINSQLLIKNKLKQFLALQNVFGSFKPASGNKQIRFKKPFCLLFLVRLSEVLQNLSMAPTKNINQF